MKNSLVLTLYFALVSCLFVAILAGAGVLNLTPKQDPARQIAVLEKRVTEIEKIIGLKPGGKLVLGNWEKGR